MTSTGEGRSVLILDRAERPRPELEQACASVGLHPRRLGDLAVGSPLAQLIDEAISNVDLVLLVIDNDPVPPSIMFEAGLAHGLGRPVVVLDGRGLKPPENTDLALDTLLPGPRLYAHLSDMVGIAEQLDAYLQLQPLIALSAEPEVIKPSERRLFQKPITFDTEGEQRTAEALMGLGAVVLADRAGSRSVPDFVVRFPQLDSSMNPVLVEIRERKAHLDIAHQQLKKALSRSHVPLGLLVVLDSLPTGCELVGPGQVVAQISLITLEKTPSQVLQLLSDARNLAVHGG